MDRRSWPWKKKSSDKTVVEKVESVIVPASAGSQGDKVKQDSYKKPNYVQISVDQYSELTGLEDQVKSYEDQVKTYDEQVKRYEDQQLVYEDQIKSLEDEVKELNEQLSEAHSEMITKENLVKQHAKVAEEAVSGWEKAEAEAATLKNHLESVTLLKLTAEDRATHLDGALKECMRQIRNLKEEHEQTVHDIVLAKTKQFEKMKLEFDTKVANLDQELMQSAAENAAVSRSLHDRSNMLVKMSEEKSQAEAEIEVLKSNVESCEREINSLKYELHIVAKELEIRNEEKNMSVRSAEVANKQHLEGVKKIAKLEAECQRLRGLVRKKLPGPAALAQMKLEVDSLGREYGETRVKRSPVKPPTTETKMLKEALTKRNTELQASRTICAKTVSKLQSLESQLQSNSQLKAVSMASVSEEANDDDVSIAGSCATAIVSENTNRLELMDDFLEMEKLANSSNDSDPLENLKSKISDLLNSLPKDSDTDKLYEEINRVVQDSVGGKYEELAAAISRIYNFMLVLRKEAKSVTGTSLEENGMFQKLEEFNETESRKMNINDFILCVAGILGKASELRFSFVGYETNDAEEASSPDCIDKVALPENKVDYSNSCNQFSDTTSDPDTPHGGNSVPTSELNVSLLKCSLEEFEQMKLEKENMSIELSKSNENLETIKSQLSETERQLSEVKSQLTAAQKLNCLSETQLKCMAESYNSLEVRSAGLQSRVNLLESKIVMLDNELEEERTKCKDTEAKCKDLQEQLQRIETPLVADVDAKNNQERELAAAAEKLAECQETIYLLGKQLNGLRPQTESMESSLSQKGQTLAEEEEENEEEEELTISNIMNIHSGNESPIHLDNHEFSPSDSEANNLSKSPVRGKHRPTKSVSSSSSSSNPTPEKNTRGFSRFFSTKPK
ncbi:putative filament-like plant protein [Helianthus annuus]|nr:putative filament-like plant protein [Helianthus annuus]KAJ0505029.1 putative filament-like plant protein [Helianthus annuus]KAJ0674714.1 putative filament-like plant protein [Helianthus annuus]